MKHAFLFPARPALRQHGFHSAAALGAAAMLLTGMSSAHAGNFTLKASDPTGGSSFTSPLTGSASGWGAGVAPTAGNTYEVTSGFTLLSPNDSNPYSFAANSLSIDAGGSFNLKGTGPGQVLTINNSAANPGGLILNGGTVIHNTGTSGDLTTLAGAITLATGTTSTIGSFANEGITINSLIGGSGNVTFGGNGGTVTINSSDTYTGATVVNSGTLALSSNAYISPTSSITVNNGGTISVGGNNNYLFTSSNVVTTLNSGGVLTILNAVTAHLGPLALAGGTLANLGGTPTGAGLQYGSWNLDKGVTAGGTAATSTISAQDVARRRAAARSSTSRPARQTALT